MTHPEYISCFFWFIKNGILKIIIMKCQNISWAATQIPHFSSACACEVYIRTGIASLCLFTEWHFFFVKTSNTLTWTFHLLSRHPQIQDRLYKEVSTFAPADENPSAAVVTRMPYLKAVIREALRWDWFERLGCYDGWCSGSTEAISEQTWGWKGDLDLRVHFFLYHKISRIVCTYSYFSCISQQQQQPA